MGQVRIPVTVDKAEETIRELRKIITALKGVDDANKQQTVTLRQIGESFTPFRRNLEVINQLRGAFNQFYGAAQVVMQGYRSLIAHNLELNTRFGQVERSWDSLITSFSRGMNSTGEVSHGLGAINTILQSMPRLAEGAGVAFVSMMRTAAQQATATLTGNPLLGQLLTLAAGQGAEALAHRQQGPSRESQAAALEKTQQRLRDQRDATQRFLEREAEFYQQEKERRSRGGRDAAADQARLKAEMARQRTALAEQEITEQYNQQLAALREELHYMDLRNQAAQLQQSIASNWIEAERMANEKRMEDAKLQSSIEQEIADRREEQVGTYLGQIGAIASATQSLGKTIASAYESMGGSSEKAKKAEGAFVVAYSSVMAVLELAESIRAFAKQDYVSGALHLVGMAAYIAAAVEAGSQLGGGAAKTPSAQTSYTPARTEGLGAPSGEQQGTTIINQYSWGRSRAEAAEAVADIEYEGARTGRVRAPDSSVWGA